MKDKLKKMIEEQETKLNGFYRDYKAYRTDNVDIFHRQLPTAQKVNNRINHDYLSSLVNNKVSHFLGNPVSITTVKMDENITALLSRFKRYTAFDRVMTEIGVQAALYGYSPVLVYIDKNGEFDFIESNAYSCYFGDDLAARLIDSEEDIEHYEVYDNKNRYFFKRTNDEIIEIESYNGIPSGKPHLFDGIPLFKIKNNKEELSEHYKVRHIISNLDRLYSDLSSEVESFRLAYIKFIGCDIEPDEVLKMIQTGALTLPENADVDFITKQLQVSTVLELIRKEEENLYTFAQSYNPQKSEHMGNLTNLGIHFTLAPINNNCKKTIHYFKEGLYNLFELYSQYLSKKNTSLDIYELDFEFTLNNPRNILEESQIQATLNGLVSDSTRLKLASFVDSVDEELLRLASENIPDIE